jgi:hypothetical protein
MKSKEKHKYFNIKLMKILDRIEKMMGNDIDSSRSISHRYHDERERTISVGRNHHHSLRHLTKISHRISSPSPVRKYKKMSRVDELQWEMNKINPPTFDGEHKNDDHVETWILIIIIIEKLYATFHRMVEERHQFQQQLAHI